MAEQLERVTNLLALLLETRAPLTLAQIGQELKDQYPSGEVAQRGAFERDKSLLRDLGVPIESTVLGGSDAGRTAYWIDRRRYELRDLELADDERAALEVAVAMARLAEADFGLLKLGGSRARSAVVANVPHLPALPTLREGVARRHEVRFAYHGGPRRVHPYSLLLRDGFWYVIGHDVDRAALRTFRVDRIEGDVEVEQGSSFDRPADFDPREAFPADARRLGDVADARATVLVRRASAVDAERDGTVVERRDDGSVVVSVPCANLDAFRSWLFGWGVDAEVLAPADVRAHVVQWLRAMVAAR